MAKNKKSRRLSDEEADHLFEAAQSACTPPTPNELDNLDSTDRQIIYCQEHLRLEKESVERREDQLRALEVQRSEIVERLRIRARQKP